MSEIKVLIVEDEELYADKMEMLIDKLGYGHLATVDNGDDALKIVQSTPPDFILMDVHIEGDRDGIELSDLIHQTLDIPIIFVTSMQDDLTFKRASRTNPVGFLNKPFNELQLQRAMELVVKRLAQVSSEEDGKEEENGAFGSDHFFIKNKSKLEKIRFEDVVYLEADGRYCTIFTDQNRYVLRSSLSELMNKLPNESIIQTHRSNAVNVKKVVSVNTEMMVIHTQNHEVPLSKRNKDEFINKLKVI